jgi:hypothetical protein
VEEREMTDPAIEAAQRAIGVNRPRWAAIVYGYQDSDLCADFALDAAREALAPLRAIHHPGAWFADNGSEQEVRNCYTCCDRWPCDTARLIYPSGEL